MKVNMIMNGMPEERAKEGVMHALHSVHINNKYQGDHVSILLHVSRR
jgi:hypothetical protein